MIIDLVPGALATDSTNRVVTSDAAADSVIQNLVDSASNNAEASGSLSVSCRAATSVSLWVKGGISCAFGAGIIDSEVKRCAVAVSSNDVEGFIGETGNSAYS